jgi:predicted enzyme related to lactoylglutathione lyase
MILRVWDITFTVSDLERAVAFYEQVLGLSRKYRFSTYAGFDCGGVEIGLQPGTPAQEQVAAPCVDLLVRNVDTAYRSLEARGVRFLKEPQDTAWGGRIALFADPDGNVLQLVELDWNAYFTACVPREFDGGPQ